jgi:hypothetical protein
MYLGNKCVGLLFALLPPVVRLQPLQPLLQGRVLINLKFHLLPKQQQGGDGKVSNRKVVSGKKKLVLLLAALIKMGLKLATGSG